MPNKRTPALRTLLQPTQGTHQGLLLCAGKDCFRNERAAFKKLEAAATNAGLELARVTCQGSCKGPTAVVPTADGPRWFENLGSKKARRDLVAFATGEGTTKTLRNRELAGKRKKKAATKLADQLS